MSMNTPTEQEIKEWWEEFEREFAKMTVPCVPMPEPPPEPEMLDFGATPFKSGGNVYYTFADDVQFITDNSKPNSVGWQ